ncbi:hypothetical protein PENSUB_8217 [Penicillium subrubescens]|uniref:Uncharacterized protein n=1 Tax=Penicillium subrubescens TaxID=1316194 RepID=A0A1Q5TIH2_9EURO|nr:hypothetical protein PENSUB_8217 [Penicillium subrubescens]
MLNDDRGYVPKWGELPVEQYMMARFPYKLLCAERSLIFRRDTGTLHRQSPLINSASGSSDNLLIWMRYPAKEIEVILRPWRSGELRQKAWQILESGNTVPIFLRTQYKSGDDEKMEEWVNASQELITKPGGRV